MKKSVCLALAVVAASFAFAGCRHHPTAIGAPGGVLTTEEHQIVLINSDIRDKITSGRPNVTYTTDGRMVVRLNIQDTGDKELRLSVRTTFKDEKGLALDTTPWEHYIVRAGAILSYEKTSVTTKARDFSVEIGRMKD